MQPQQNSNMPSIKQPGDWSPLNHYSNDIMPPKRQTFLGRYKKLFIIAGAGLVLLVGLGVVAKLSGSGGVPSRAKSSVAMKSYDGTNFKLSYASGLQIIGDDSDLAGGWALTLAPNPDAPYNNLSIYQTSSDQLYVDSEDGLKNQQDTDQVVNDIKTTEINLAGVKAQKTVGTVEDDEGNKFTVVFSYTKVGDKYIVVSAKYPQNTEILDGSIDATMSSISIK